MVYEQVKRGWTRSSEALADTDAFWQRSAARLVLLRRLRAYAVAHVRGKVLDAGAGSLSFRQVVQPFCTEYRSLDLRRSHKDLDIIGDVQRMPLPDAQFDTVVCIEVLEHVPRPDRALEEVARVLVPGGKALISVPHFMYLHNEPNDYYRYTKYGLRELLERAGFVVLHLESAGGFFSFLQHLCATVGVGLTYGIPVVWPVFFTVNRAVSAFAVWLDDHTEKRKLFALYYVAVVQKPSALLIEDPSL